MKVFRIVKSKARVSDLSGTGAFLNGGRWNFENTYALYTSEHASLAVLETLVHLEEGEMPKQLYIMELELPDDDKFWTPELAKLPPDWRHIECFGIRKLGTLMLNTNHWLGLKVPSAVLPMEYNFVLNPIFPDFENKVRLSRVSEYVPDSRLR